jgi:pyruvate dehydrogenase E2 component (dihydrolipoamide acetyltransferase)
MFEFKMPSLGADMENGTLVLWHVKAGDTVKRGDIIADVETDKGVIEVEVWEPGTISELLIEPGRKIAVGTVMALLQSEKEPFEKIAEAPRPQVSVGPEREHRLRVSPLARKRAAERGLDLALIHGTGPYGAITVEDVEKAPTAREAAPSPDKSAAMRQAIAQSMARSKREIPHYYLQTEINLQKAMAWLEGFNQNRSLSERVLPAALFIKATAKACQKVPEMNGYWMDGNFHPSTAVHVGLAISLRQGGLVGPALHHVESLGLPDIMKGMLDLVARARSGKLRSSEISDPTITITNLGEQGVETVFGVIYPPQVALLGFGKITPRPWADQHMLGVMPCVSLTLSADHRASDGHRGGLFLNHIKHFLEDPESLEEAPHGS